MRQTEPPVLRFSRLQAILPYLRRQIRSPSAPYSPYGAVS